MKRKLKKTFIYTVYLKIRYLLFPLIIKKNRINRSIPIEIATTNEKYDGKKIIISLTSFPGRIDIVHKALYSLMNQTMKPNKIVLWLSKLQFPNADQDLPNKLLDLKKYGLEIEWLDDDIKSYKKLIPALEKYPEDIIVTADDDLYYQVDWLEKLYKSYSNDKNSIHCHMITRLKKTGNKVDKTKKKKDLIGSNSFSNKLLGVGGCLYPPHVLYKDVFNKELFMKLAPTSDDIWFWGMALKNNTKITWIKNGMKKLVNIEYSQEKTECLTNINDGEKNLFYKHLNIICKKYNLFDKIDE